MNNHLTLNFLNKQDQAGFEPLTFQLPILHTSSVPQSHMISAGIFNSRIKVGLDFNRSPAPHFSTVPHSTTLS